MDSGMNHQESVVTVQNLKKYFPIRSGFFRKAIGNVKAVEDVSFTIAAGETLGLVGESGCGKTTVGRCICRGIDPTSGTVLFRTRSGDEVDLASLEHEPLRQLRRDFQMVFQDPNSSLDPRMTVYDIICEPLIVNGYGKRGTSELDDRVKELAAMVHLNVAHMKRYPHAFSGGQRQRIGIARALATRPRLIVADEAVSALDVSVQAQVINLLKDLQLELNLAYLFVAHDLSVVQHISDKVAVMYLGLIVEAAPTDELFFNPKHPYTEALLSAVPKADPDRKDDSIELPGEVPNPASPPSGCYFHPRCSYATEVCSKTRPDLREIAPGHQVACHRADELSLTGVGADG